MPPSVMWFRRDLRLADHPALLAAMRGASGDGGVVALFVDDPVEPTETARRVWLCASLRDLSERLGGALVVRRGKPTDVVVDVARAVGATSVYVTADTTSAGMERDDAVRTALADDGRDLVAVGCPYAVAPGKVTKPSGGGYLVYTPFKKAWLATGWPAPAPDADGAVPWHTGLDSETLPTHDGWAELTAPPAAGERAAGKRLEEFCANRLDGYAENRDRPDLDGTSDLSAALAHGEIHPRTILAAIAGREGRGAEVFRSEVAWREFYGDVLWRNPHTATDYYRREFAHMAYDEPGTSLRAWKFGQTGFPFVDAGMRQLRSTGWMHNRVRMVVASFLVKDLHIEWQHGARWFMNNLYDADLASNSHGWQWTAGCGTDAAPYFRIFNPITQGLKFDPHGDYVRRFVPELAHLPGAAAHEPWKHAHGYTGGYPQRVVDHSEERTESLRRYEEIKGGAKSS